LVVGENRITATADDGQGIHGNDVVIIANP
jgi:hypothetical protein